MFKSFYSSEFWLELLFWYSCVFGLFGIGGSLMACVCIRAIRCSYSYKNPRPQPADDKEFGISASLLCVVKAVALYYVLFVKRLGRQIRSYVLCMRRRLG